MRGGSNCFGLNRLKVNLHAWTYWADQETRVTPGYRDPKYGAETQNLGGVVSRSPNLVKNLGQKILEKSVNQRPETADPAPQILEPKS